MDNKDSNNMLGDNNKYPYHPNTEVVKAVMAVQMIESSL